MSENVEDKREQNLRSVPQDGPLQAPRLRPRALARSIASRTRQGPARYLRAFLLRVPRTFYLPFPIASRVLVGEIEPLRPRGGANAGREQRCCR